MDVDGKPEQPRDRSGVNIGDVRGGIVGSIFAGGNVIQNVTNLFSGSHADRERRDKLVLLNKVKEFWVSGVLDQSVHRISLIELGKSTDTDAVADARPWDMVVEAPELKASPKDSAAGIGAIFDAMSQAILILGQPGSGKTITLLELARDRIDLAERNPVAPIPVVFNLSSWAAQGKTLSAWLVAELNAKYQIPTKIGAGWIEQNDLVVLLDGLDEVEAARRADCVHAINGFRDEHGLTGLAVCSRAEEYDSGDVRLKLHGAIRIQPLTLAQVDRYIAAAGPSVSTLGDALRIDPGLQELAQVPLMLSIMCLAYQNIPAEQLEPQGVGARRRHLFAAYVDRMFARRKSRQRYTREQALEWLRWLAQNMAADSQSVFLIEQMQPGWLTTNRQRFSYAVLSRLATAWLITVAFLIPVGALGVFREGIVQYLFFYGTALAIGYAGAGLALGLADAWRLKRWSARKRTEPAPGGMWRFAGRFLRNSLIAFIGFALGWVGVFVAGGDMFLSGAVVLVLTGTIFFAPLLSLPLAFVLAIRGRRGARREIETIETLAWSWKRFGWAIALAGILPAAATLGITWSIRETGASLYSADGRMLAPLYGQTSSEVGSVAFSPDGSRIVTTADTNSLRTADGTQIATLGPPTSSRAPEFSSNSSRLILPEDNAASLWNAADGTLVARLDSMGRFNADSTRVLVGPGFTDSDMKGLVDARDGQVISGFKPCRASSNEAWFNRDGSRVLALCDDDNAHLWDAADGRTLATFSTPAHFSPDGAHIVNAAKMQTELRLAATGELQSSLDTPLKESAGWVFSDDGSRLATVAPDGTAKVWTLKDGALAATLEDKVESYEWLRFNPQGSRLLERHPDADVVLWDADTGKRVKTFARDSSLVMRFSPDGSVVATADASGAVRLWGQKDGQLIATVNGGELPPGLTQFKEDSVRTYPIFDPTSTRMLTVDKTGTPRLWSARSDSPIATLDTRVDASAENYMNPFDAFFSPDGKRLVTVATGGEAKMWDARTGAFVTVLRKEPGPASTIAFAPDGTRLVVATGTPSDLRAWSAVWIPFGVVIGLFTGLARTVRATKTRANQGILLTAKNAAVVGAAISLLSVLFLALGSRIFDWELQWASILGAAGALGALVAFGYGGVDVVEHYVLRLVLRMTRSMSWNCAGFLDFAVERVLLRRVGGGYIFIHRSLLEYFAEDEESRTSVADGQLDRQLT